MPAWAKVLIALLTVVTLVAVAVAVFASRGRQLMGQPAPSAVAPPAKVTPTKAPTKPSGNAQTLADGCLGGPSDLERAVLKAQRQAPLTPAGAAAFTATLVRWVFDRPRTHQQQVTAAKILAPSATDRARRSITGAQEEDGSTAILDFRDGRYYVESFDGRSAVVSWSATAHGTDHGRPLTDATVGGAAHLKVINGMWFYVDQTLARSLANLEQVGTPYAGGC